MTEDTFILLSDEEVERYRDRAYVEAARCWAEFHTAPKTWSASVRAMLFAGAVEASRYHDALRLSYDARATKAVSE